jgi:hypothetical protein
MQFPFNRNKFKELVLYVATKSTDDPNFSATKLNKLLCFSDFYAYARLGQPITGATYRALQYGPVPRELSDVQQELRGSNEAVTQCVDRLGYTQRRLIPLRAPNLQLFTAAEIALVDEVIDEFWNHSAGAVSQRSHRELVGWQLAPAGGDIPYASVFLASPSLTPADIQAGRAFARQHGFLADVGG